MARKKKYMTLGEGFKVRPKLIKINNRWHAVDPEAWNLVQQLEVKELKKKKLKKVT
jgi:hypothetical protein